MPLRILSAALIGIEAQIIEVEIDISFGLRCFNIVGLPDKAVAESKERVGSAVKSSGFQPHYSQPLRVLVSLAPAHLKKEGSLYDLPIALGYLAASKQIRPNFKDKIFIGELSLDGKLKPVKGILPIVLEARKRGFSEIILPKENASESALVQNLRVIGVGNLKQAVRYLENREKISPFKSLLEIFLKNKPIL